MERRESGSGEAVLLVHGFPFSGALWDEQLRSVPPGWRFIAPDLPGFGASPLERPDSMPTLPTIEVPTLVVVGAEDAVTPVADAERLARGIPQASLHVIPNVGHASCLEAPTAFNAALDTFLATL